MLLYLKRDGECFVYVNETPQGLSLKIIDPDSVDESVDNPSKNILCTDFIVFLAVLSCFETCASKMVL